jgi:hypothetical protein
MPFGLSYEFRDRRTRADGSRVSKHAGAKAGKKRPKRRNRRRP